MPLWVHIAAGVVAGYGLLVALAWAAAGITYLRDRLRR